MVLTLKGPRSPKATDGELFFAFCLFSKVRAKLPIPDVTHCPDLGEVGCDFVSKRRHSPKFHRKAKASGPDQAPSEGEEHDDRGILTSSDEASRLCSAPTMRRRAL